MPAALPPSRMPLPLIGGFLLFLVGLAYMVASSMARPAVFEFAPRVAASGARPATTMTLDTVTIDARDEHAWQFLSLRRTALLAPPDTADWDLAFRRFHVISSGEIADAGKGSFEELALAPTTGYQATTFGGDTLNPAIEHWYRYGMLTHLLSPDGRVYVVRTRQGHYAKLEFLSYYCPGTSPGCVTLRYALQPSGEPRFP